jgi:hypothetical protein
VAETPAVEEEATKKTPAPRVKKTKIDEAKKEDSK